MQLEIDRKTAIQIHCWALVEIERYQKELARRGYAASGSRIYKSLLENALKLAEQLKKGTKADTESLKQ